MASFRDITTKAMKRLYLSRKSDEKVTSLQISSPIEGTFIHHAHVSAPNPDVLPDYHANIDNNEPIMPRRFSDLVILTENWHRQLIGTRHALASLREVNHGLERQNTMMHLQIERSGDMMATLRNLRQDMLAMKKQATEDQKTIATLKSSGGKTRNKLKTEVGLLTLENTYLEGMLQETLWDTDEHYARLEFLALSILETLAEARDSGRGVQVQ